MTIYYGNSENKICIGHAETRQEINEILYNYVTGVLKSEIYYTRHWKTPDGLEAIDFGSWSKCMYISDETTDEEVVWNG